MTVHSLKISSTPYTYILEWTKLGKRYIGARWAKGCHPSDLWTKYFTSSKYVADFVAMHGAPDLILIDKTFSSPQEAMSREQDLQYQYEVRYNEAFLNKAIAGVWNHLDPEIVKRHRESHLGYKHTEVQKAKNAIAHRGRKRPLETGRRISEAKKGKKQSAEHIEKHRQAMIGRKQSPEHVAKRRIKMLGNKSRTGQVNSEETRRKMSMAQTGKKQNRIECPHCHKTGGYATMPRWHFDNCKSLKGL